MTRPSYPLRLPADVAEQVRRAAHKAGCSVNAWLSAVVADSLGVPGYAITWQLTGNVTKCTTQAEAETLVRIVAGADCEFADNGKCYTRCAVNDEPIWLATIRKENEE